MKAPAPSSSSAEAGSPAKPGSIAASFVVARLRSDRLRVAGVLGGFGLSALVCVGIGLVPTFPGYLGLLVALGLFNAVANGGTGPLFLLRTPEELRGRVMAALGGSFAAASVVALVFGGLAGTWLGPRVTFVAGGGLAFLVVLGMAAVSLPAVAAAAASSAKPSLRYIISAVPPSDHDKTTAQARLDNVVFPRVVHEKNGDRQPKTLIPRLKHRIVTTWQMSVLCTDNQDGRENLPETQ